MNTDLVVFSLVAMYDSKFSCSSEHVSIFRGFRHRGLLLGAYKLVQRRDIVAI